MLAPVSALCPHASTLSVLPSVLEHGAISWQRQPTRRRSYGPLLSFLNLCPVSAGFAKPARSDCGSGCRGFKSHLSPQCLQRLICRRRALSLPFSPLG